MPQNSHAQRSGSGNAIPMTWSLLALALHLGVPVWSNDNDFADAGVKWYTTAELLTGLGITN